MASSEHTDTAADGGLASKVMRPVVAAWGSLRVGRSAGWKGVGWLDGAGGGLVANGADR